MRGPARAAPGVVLAALVLLFPSRALALDPSLDVSQYAHTAWRIRDGFTRGRIVTMAQTPDGYLWLGTEFGLVRFDGVRAVPWSPPEPQRLPSSYVTTLVAAPDATLWIGTRKGLASWRDGKLTSYPEVAGRLVLKLKRGPDGTLWFGANDPDGGRVPEVCAVESGKVRCEQAPELGASLLALLPDRVGNVWVASTTGLWRWKPGPREHHAYPAPVTAANDLIEDGEGALLLATNDGVKRFAGGRIQSHSFPGLEAVLRPSRFRYTSDGSLWVSTFEGLVHVHQGRTDRFGVADGLSHQYVMSLFEDREGNVWASTAAGLHRFRGYRFPTFSVKQGLSAGIWAVQATADGSVWMSATDGLYRWRDGHVESLGKPPEAPGGFESLAVDLRGRLWASGADGVFRREGDRFVRAPGLPAANAIFAIAPDLHGSAWIGIRGRGLVHGTAEGRTEELPWTHFGKSAGAAALLVDPADESLWLGFIDGGVSRYADGRVRSYGPAEGLGAGRVSHLRPGEHGTVWAATEGGLSRIEDGRVATLTTANGLPCDTVYWSMEDDDGAVWLYLSCGLARVARSELDAWVKDPQRTVAAAVFDASDGIRTVAFPAGPGPTITKAADGRIWFTPFDGVTVIDPRHLPRNDLPPPVHIERVTADGVVFDAAAVGGGRLRLPPHVRDLAIEYTALSLAAPEKVRFRIKLEGQDREFRELVNERHVRYTNLPPRTYRFLVKAANDAGVWNEDGAVVDLVVPPALHQTTWFRALAVAAAAALLWAAYRVRVGVLERRRRLLIDAQEEERARIAGELHDGVLQQLGAVTLELGAIKVQLPPGAPAKAELASAQSKLVEIGRDIRSLSHELHSSMLQEGGLAPALSSYCVEYSKARGLEVSCAADPVDSALPPSAALALYRIAQEALGNVAKHAQAKHAQVRLERGNGVVRLTVSDDGVGFVPADAGRSGGVGVSNMRARIRALGGRFEVESQPGRGTTIRAEVPSRGTRELPTGVEV